jgi:uncharacterized protein
MLLRCSQPEPKTGCTKQSPAEGSNAAVDAATSPIFSMRNALKKTRPRTGKDDRKGSALEAFCAWDGETLVLNVLGEPNAAKDAIGKVKGKQLKISVTATPVAGKATDHMVRFLAREFGVAVTDIEVVFGRYNVNKQLRIKSPVQLPGAIEKHLANLQAATG